MKPGTDDLSLWAKSLPGPRLATLRAAAGVLLDEAVPSSAYDVAHTAAGG